MPAQLLRVGWEIGYTTWNVEGSLIKAATTLDSAVQEALRFPSL
jgi:hypothetical protein